MKNKPQLSVVVAMSASLILMGSLLFVARAGLAPTIVEAQTDPAITSTLPRTITVVGQGKVNVKPDVARLRLALRWLNPPSRRPAAKPRP